MAEFNPSGLTGTKRSIPDDSSQGGEWGGRRIERGEGRRSSFSGGFSSSSRFDSKRRRVERSASFSSSNSSDFERQIGRMMSKVKKDLEENNFDVAERRATGFFSQKGLKPNVRVWVTFLHSASTKGRASLTRKYARFIFEAASQGPQTKSSYKKEVQIALSKALLATIQSSGLSSEEKIEKIKGLISDLIRYGFFPDAANYTTLVQYAREVGNATQAVAWAREMFEAQQRERKLLNSQDQRDGQVILNITLSALKQDFSITSSEKVAQAGALFNLFETAGFSLNIILWNTMASLASNAGDAVVTRHCVHKMLLMESDPHFNQKSLIPALINALTCTTQSQDPKRWEEVEHLILDARSCSVFLLTRAVLSVVIGAAREEGNSNTADYYARKFLFNLDKQSLEDRRKIGATVGIALDAYARKGALDKAESLLAYSEDRGIEIDRPLMSIIVKAALKANNLGKAMDWAEKMLKRWKSNPQEESPKRDINSVLNAIIERGKDEGTSQIWGQAKTFFDRLPLSFQKEASLINTLIKGARYFGDIDKGKEVLVSFLSSSSIRKTSEKEQIKTSCEMFLDLIAMGENDSDSSSLSSAQERFQEMEAFYQTMAEAGISFSERMVYWMTLVACQAGEWDKAYEIAQRVFSMRERFGANQVSELFYLLLSYYRLASSVEQANKLWEHGKEMGIVSKESPFPGMMPLAPEEKEIESSPTSIRVCSEIIQSGFNGKATLVFLSKAFDRLAEASSQPQGFQKWSCAGAFFRNCFQKVGNAQYLMANLLKVAWKATDEVRTSEENEKIVNEACAVFDAMLKNSDLISQMSWNIFFDLLPLEHERNEEYWSRFQVFDYYPLRQKEGRRYVVNLHDHGLGIAQRRLQELISEGRGEEVQLILGVGRHSKYSKGDKIVGLRAFFRDLDCSTWALEYMSNQGRLLLRPISR